ncbi:MAG: phenylacetate--CoA ligase family protein, partial [Planctomycetota bacterium]
MGSLQQELYWNAPYFIKEWMASLNARKLDRQRYGPEYYQILDQIAEHDNWTTDLFSEYQRCQLQSLIQHVVVKVPYYRELFSELHIDPKSISGPEDLQRLPILEKQTVRSNAKSILDETLAKRQLMILHTSGTTGTPLDIYRDVRLYAAAFAYLDARWHKIAGMSRRINRSVSIGGHLVTGPNQIKPPFWVYNRRWKQLYMSSYHLCPQYLGHYMDELRKFKADYIEGYPSSVYAIARHIVDNNLGPVPFKACFTTAETLFDHQREAIKEAFCCRTYDQYGCGEMVVFAAECEHGS